MTTIDIEWVATAAVNPDAPSVYLDGWDVVTGPLRRTLWCVCGQPVAEHPGKANGGGLPEAGCKRRRLDPESRTLLAAGRTVERTLGQDLRAGDLSRNRARTKHKRKHGKWGVGASDASSCRAAIGYRENPPADLVTNVVDKRAALMGTIIHEGVRRIRKRRYPWRSYEMDVFVPGFDTVSRCDEYDPILGIVFDLKTSGSAKWDMIAVDGPPEGEWEQVMLYGLGLRAAGHFVHEVRIVYVQRADGRDEVYVRPYDEAVALAAVDRLTAVLDMLDHDVQPPRDREGPSTDAICRNYCPARDHCWNVPEAERQGRSPESWTLVMDDADVEHVLGEYVAHRTVEGAAKKEKERYKALFEGVPEGQYGDIVYRHNGGNLLPPAESPTARVTQLEQFYDLPEDQRPPLVDLPYPKVQKRSNKVLQVKPVRAATAQRRRRFPSIADPSPIPTVDLVHPGRA